MSKVATQLGPCQVRSETDRACRRPAVVIIRGVPFCGPCACEQEAYFAIGKLTESSLFLCDESLADLLDRVRHRTERRRVRAGETDAA